MHQRMEHFCAGSSLTRWHLRDYRMHPAEAYLRITEVRDDLSGLCRLAALVMRNVRVRDRLMGAYLDAVASQAALERYRWFRIVRRWLDEGWVGMRDRGEAAVMRLECALVVPPLPPTTGTDREDQRSARRRLNRVVKRSVLELRAAMGEVVFLSGGSIIPAGSFRLPDIAALCFRHTLWLLGPSSAIEVPLISWAHHGDRALALARTGVSPARMVVRLTSGPVNPFSSSAGLFGVRALSVGAAAFQWYVAPSLSTPAADSVRVVLFRSARPALTVDAKWRCPVGILLMAAAEPFLRDSHLWFGMQRLVLSWTLAECRPWMAFSPMFLFLSVCKRRPRRSSVPTELFSGLP